MDNNLKKLLGILKKGSTRGRCLHFDSDGCKNFIKAHSIQKGNQLNLIAEDHHVYQFSSDYSVLSRNDGMPAPVKVSSKKASTFMGFCKDHDNELFTAIDNHFLQPNYQQVSLYAYRCLCRELFVKENAVDAIKEVLSHPHSLPEIADHLKRSVYGHELALHRLKYHKQLYDRAMRHEQYEEFEFITFESFSQWNIQLSGVLFPDFDFQGNPLQELLNINLPLDFLTFFTAPTVKGWSLTFCWHKSSSHSCLELIRSLHSSLKAGSQLQDALLRFSISCCENHVLRISWWDNLHPNLQQSMINRVALMVSPSETVPSDYIGQGLEGIADWKIDAVYSEYEI